MKVRSSVKPICEKCKIIRMVSISLVDVITYCRFVLLLTITDKLSSFAAAVMNHPAKL